MHKTIGIVGGMTPESTTLYYEHITRTYQDRYGNYGFPRIVINSMSFQQFLNWMNGEDWPNITAALTNAVQELVRAGADLAVIATNTMHNVFTQVQNEASIPMISIIDATAEAVQKQKIDTIGLLGTRFTMEKSFYKEGLAKYNIKTLVPNTTDQEVVHRIIFDELGKGLLTDLSKSLYLDVIEKLKTKGSQGIILGCTEIPLLIKADDCSLPLFDTALIHAEAALNAALNI